MARRLAGTAILLLLLSLAPEASRALTIHFIDVEGGQSTLLITPAGESLLIDAGYAMRGQRGAPPPPPGTTVGRDAQRILDTLAAAGVEQLDYLLITHFHSDHAGGVPELAARFPIRTFVDYGDPLGSDRLTATSFRAYQPVRAATSHHVLARAGERLPLRGVVADVVSAGGTLISQPSPVSPANRACANTEDHIEDGTENFRSIGIRVTYGNFTFLNLGDLSGNTLTSLVCPVDRVGPVSAYQIAHHGDYDTSVPALYATLKPRVAIMNNGPTKGGHPAAFDAVRTTPGIDLWQLHLSPLSARNAPTPFIANIDDGTETAFGLKLTAWEDGTFEVRNPRTDFVRTYR